MSISHTEVPRFASQLQAVRNACPGEQQIMAYWVPATHVGNLDYIPDSQLQPIPDLATIGIWGVNIEMGDFFLFLPPTSISPFLSCSLPPPPLSLCVCVCIFLSASKIKYINKYLKRFNFSRRT